MSMLIKCSLFILVAVFSFSSYAEDWPKYRVMNNTDEPIQVYWKEGNSCYGIPGEHSPVTIPPEQSFTLNTQVNSHVGCQIVNVDFIVTNTKSVKKRGAFRGIRAQNLILKNTCYAEETYQKEFNLAVSHSEAACDGAQFTIDVTKAP